MREYAVSLTVCALTVGLISALCPVDYRKYVNGAGSVLFLIVFLSPIRSLDGFNIDALSENYRLMAENYISQESVSDIRESIADEYITAGLNALGYTCSAETEIEDLNGELHFVSATVITEVPLSDEDYRQVLAYVCRQTGLDDSEITVIVK